jgi:gluconate 2-dehydrogenase subunit 3-like protein
MSDSTNSTRLSADEERLLASVLDEIIPPRDDGGLPGAGQLGITTYVDDALRKTPELHALIIQGLAELDTLARDGHGEGFAALARRDKVQLLNQWGFVLPLTLHTCTGYYQHPRVVAALGLEARAPHPKGYEMEPNDLSLLDAVRRRPKSYRTG